MTENRPAKLIDPACGMSVDVETAEVAGLLLERDGRTYGFCRSGCRPTTSRACSASATSRPSSRRSLSTT